MTPADHRAESIAIMRGILIGVGPVIGGLLVIALFTAGVWGPALVGWLS